MKTLPVFVKSITSQVFILSSGVFRSTTTWSKCQYVFTMFTTLSAVARVSEAPPEISRGAPHTLLAYYYELQ